jgi:zinc and cadmium transporter
MNPILWAFASVIAVGAVSLAGLMTLSLNEARIRSLATLFVSFAAGALLGDTFIHLVPDIFARSGERDALRASLLILAGMLLFFCVEKLLRHEHGILHRHHHFEPTTRPELAAINLLGDAVHNYIDGLLIGASWLAGPELGVSTTIAVILHEIPQELGDFSILVHSGLSVRNAALLNAASAAVAIAGTATAVIAGAVLHARVVTFLVPITAGGFVYIAAADLIPELQHDRTLRGLAVQSALIACGIAVMALLTLAD